MSSWAWSSIRPPHLRVASCIEECSLGIIMPKGGRSCIQSGLLQKSKIIILIIIVYNFGHHKTYIWLEQTVLLVRKNHKSYEFYPCLTIILRIQIIVRFLKRASIWYKVCQNVLNISKVIHILSIVWIFSWSICFSIYNYINICNFFFQNLIFLPKFNFFFQKSSFSSKNKYFLSKMQLFLPNIYVLSPNSNIVRFCTIFFEKSYYKSSFQVAQFA